MENWHEWRGQGLGASDAPVVMGVSPWKTRFQLYEEKAGLVALDKTGNWATKRGNELEPKARADYEFRNNLVMPVAFVQHKDHPFIRASLDGFNEEESIVLEIKCPGKEDHQTAYDGKVPEKYWPQVQHQLLASGARELHYYSFDGERGVIVVVRPDKEYCELLLLELTKFWTLVRLRTPPDMVDKDFKDIKDPALIAAIKSWQTAKESLVLCVAAESLAKDLITKSLEDHPRWRCGDVKITKTKRIGNVDYSKIPELSGVDLNKYRKTPSEFWVIK